MVSGTQAKLTFPQIKMQTASQDCLSMNEYFYNNHWAGPLDAKFDAQDSTNLII